MRFIGFSHPPIIQPSLTRSLPSIASRGMSTMEREEGSTEMMALIDSADRSKEQGSVSSLGIGPIFVPTLHADTCGRRRGFALHFLRVPPKISSSVFQSAKV